MLKIKGRAILFLMNVVLAFLTLPILNKAMAEGNISGWAWSDNIGWISFNCVDQGICGSVNYGVNINISTGLFSGYAWSENIGWINFSPPGPYPEAPNYSAKLDMSTKQIKGWIRACTGTINGDCNSPNIANGWDGWIKMSGSSSDGSSFGVSFSDYNLSGYAWGSDVIGWIKFNSSASSDSTPPASPVNVKVL